MSGMVIKATVAQLNTANYLSLSRVLLGFTVPLWWQFDSWLTFVIVAIAAITDGLDGYVARKLRQETPLGRQLDPLADKIFTLCVLAWLTYLLHWPALSVLLVLTFCYDADNTWQRRIDISLALKGVAAGPQQMAVGLLSKTKTAWLFVVMLSFVPVSWHAVAHVVTIGGSLLIIASWWNNRVIRKNRFRSRYFPRH